MNKTIWLEAYSDLPCPSCTNGLLHSVNQQLKHETLASLARNEYHKNGQVAPDEDFIVTEHLRCSRCEDWVSLTYKLSYDVRNVDEERNELPEIERLFYYPAPPIISIPPSCPAAITNILHQSFSLYWTDADACGNKIRIAVEALMDQYKILHASKATLHQKIESFKAINSEIADYLLAIKWIGNVGSHSSSLNKKDLLDAYELTEYSLHQLYKDKEMAIKQLSLEINQKRGPRT